MPSLPDPSFLWCATTGDQFAKIASMRWRGWPADEDLRTTDSLDEATAAAHELARTQGVGHVIKLVVATEFAQRHQGGNVPPESRDRLVASLQHAISEHAQHRGGLPEVELAAAETRLRRSIPTTWRSYLQGAHWFHRGWMRSGAYVWLYPARQSAEFYSDDDCPGMFVIGGDGASERLVVDLRQPSPQVRLANVVCADWGETFVQAASLESFLAEVAAGTFEFSFS
ncbi:MAG TPA: SMI1/KNR4 family protein [Polyangiaceae bacterium]|nr:SMI1/KNR4 family protein [Polyangiaceae bacterium]